MTIKSIPLPNKELREQAIRELIDKGMEPSPENLLKRSMEKDAPLHSHFTSIRQKDWAEYGRYESARKIIDNTYVEFVRGGQTIETRMVEYVREGEHGRWATINEILSDPQTSVSYMKAIEDLMKQAQDKMHRLRMLTSDEAA